METSISIASVKLNPNDHYKKCILIKNDNGILVVDPELFVISFANEEDVTNTNVSIINEFKQVKVKL